MFSSLPLKLVNIWAERFRGQCQFGFGGTWGELDAVDTTFPDGIPLDRLNTTAVKITKWTDWMVPSMTTRYVSFSGASWTRSCSISGVALLHTLRIKTWLYTEPWKRCVQRTQKAGLGLNTSQTTHEVNDLFLFVGTHFRICVRKFIVHLRTVYASPKKLAQPLHICDEKINLPESQKVIGQVLPVRQLWVPIEAGCKSRVFLVGVWMAVDGLAGSPQHGTEHHYHLGATCGLALLWQAGCGWKAFG